MQQTERTAWQRWSPRHKGAAFSAVIFLLLFPGCAQLDQMRGKQADSSEQALPAQAAGTAPSAPAPVNTQAQTAESTSKPGAKKKTDDSHQASATKESSPAPANPAASMSGVVKQSDPAAKQSEQDKALAEKEQSQKEKKSRVSSDKKKKPSKPQADSQPPTEDVFLSPVPLPSKPAAIGGSGG
jgi:hypothetical protein